ncbi:MAG: type ISP restriction/modification enzyme [Bacteroidota bacterium]|nr:type ISP restriction/modification enzyme [Bacteroidota bacterium]
MSIHAIKQYQSEVEKIIHFGGTKKETSIRNAFYHLLNEYAKQKGLMLVPEVTIRTPKGKNVTPDGTLKDSLRQDWGYWESKDEADIIDDEIKKKFAKDYPSDNILFEDSNTAVLIQNNLEVLRVKMKDAEALDRILHNFINFERPEVKSFRKAIELFKQDIPKVTDTIRDLLEVQEKTNSKFRKERDKFLKLCHDSINPEVTKADVREMIIQHILTEDIFNTIFDETQFHRENNIAHQLEGVINTFFTGAVKRTALSKLQSYSQAINAAAAGIADHHEKQKFLKVVYETFYKSYNPKAADRLGVVYTPNEIVKFMIESTDYLLHKHFGKFLEDKGVEILDPATGTGTFICDIIDYIRKDKLEYKYKNELHANEVAILPYYISNLNIEFTYTQKMGKYSEFENLCFVDTLDNMGFAYRGKQMDMFAPFTEENSKRIHKQNTKKISVVIGNPPYNANQANENDNNKNREYKEIDQRIKDTFIKHSTAQKTKVYDMYARFYRWTFDRLDSNGIVAFVTNRSFIDSRTFDGFRKVVASEFNHIYIVDLGGDVRSNPKLSGTKHNVFGIQTGVAICFMVRKNNIHIAKNKKEFEKLKTKLDLVEEPVVLYGKKELISSDGCKIWYIRRPEMETADEKLDFLSSNTLENIPFEHIQPDKSNNWINLADTDFENLLPICDKSVKDGNSKKALFELFSMGVVTNRDEWAYDFNRDKLSNKIKFFYDKYSQEQKRWEISSKKNKINDFVSREIKWTSELEAHLVKGTKLKFNKDSIIPSLYRPFTKMLTYYERVFTHRVYQQDKIFPIGKPELENFVIGFNGKDSPKPFTLLAFNSLTDLNSLSPAAGGTKCLPLYRYDENANRIDNITDWGSNQFTKQYGKKGITKEAIFHYVYAILHNPAYRKKYELNLKREFPRIPFYKDFKKWSDWGKALMDLHLNYETVKPFKLKDATTKEIKNPKCKLKADKESGIITLDEATTLSGVPAEAWNYKLGNRSALEWVLDQYKEKKPSDPTIAEKFNTYKFADYKEQVIDLLKRVCTVSVETMKIVNQMSKE